jgi:leucyl-tRNA synthetase
MTTGEIRVIPVLFADEIRSGDDLAEKLQTALRHQKLSLRADDILVIKHKVVSKAEGQVVQLSEVNPSRAAKDWGQKCGTDARLIELATHAARVAAAGPGVPRALAEPLVLMTAPFVPHIAEELWAALGHPRTLAYESFPEFDEALAAEQMVTLPVQIDSKIRFLVQVPAAAQRDEIAAVVTAHPEYARWTQGRAVARLIIVPGRIANVMTRAPDARP